MFWLYKILRGVVKAIASEAAPWQIALGTFLGALLGFLPLFPSQGPSPIGFGLLAVAILINCHFGSVLVWMGFCAVLGKILTPVALAIGTSCSGLAEWSAGVPLLASSHWNHTGWLGRTLLGLALAPVFAGIMWWFTGWFRAKLQARLAENRRLTLAGKFAGNSMLMRMAFWFFGL